MTLPNWDFAKLEELIQARGEDVIVETGLACTCRNGDAYGSMIERQGEPASYRRLNCDKCQGDGFIYRNARCVRGLVTSVDPGKHKKLIEAGYVVPGDAVFSPSMTETMISDFDKVTFQFAQPVNEGQVILRGSAHMEDNAQMPLGLDEAEDRLWYVASCAIWCEDEDGVVYSEGADFEFESRKIRWIGNQPRVGKLYTLKYWGFPEWIAYASPFLRFDRNRSLGIRVIIRKKHVAFNNGSQAATPQERQAEQMTFTSGVEI